MVDGKAKLLRDDYCDGLGDCLPACPAGAISFVEREAAAYDRRAVEKNLRSVQDSKKSADLSASPSELMQWPVQIRLAPITAPYFEDASLLIAADCTAYAYASIHRDFMSGRVTLIGCPKLDNIDYSEKLTEILRQNTIRDITVLRIEVPCCGGIELAVKNALRGSGKFLPWQTVTISTEGEILR